MAKILITDDHPFFRMGVNAVLEMGGHVVVAAANDAAEARTAIANSNPEIILLDIRLPGVDGISVLRELRGKGDNRPVIILTVELTDDQLLAAMQCRVDEIVFKHEGEDKLLEAIDAVQRGLKFIDGELFDRALATASKLSTSSVLDGLTRRERDVACQVARGMRNREIAETLNTTEGTIKVHLHKIYTKVEVKNRTELASIVANENSHDA